MSANDRERLSAVFREAERSLPPLRPDRAATIEGGRRLLRNRRLATLATAGAVFAVLTGGGIAARAALHDEESPTTRKDNKAREDGRTTTQQPANGKTTAALPDLVVRLARTEKGATLTVANVGGADAEAFVVAVGSGERAYNEPFEGLAAGAEETRSYTCEGGLSATVDPEDQVEEANEDNNSTKSECGPVPPTETTDTTDTSDTTDTTSAEPEPNVVD